MKNGSTYETFIELHIILLDSVCFRIESLKCLSHVFLESCWLKFFHLSLSFHAFLLLQDFLKIVYGTDLWPLLHQVHGTRSGIDDAHVVPDIFKVLIQISAKVSRESLEKVFQVTFQVLVCEFSHRYLQFELADDPKKIVIDASLECGLDDKVWLLVHIPCSSSKLRSTAFTWSRLNTYSIRSLRNWVTATRVSKLLQLRRHVCQSSVFYRLVIDQCTGYKFATSKTQIRSDSLNLPLPRSLAYTVFFQHRSLRGTGC